MAAQQATTTSETSPSAPKKEGGFHLPSIPLFENAVHSIKGTLGLDNSTKADSSADKTTTDQTDSAAATTKKESGFSFPTMASLDSKMQSLKETLGFESSTKTSSSASPSSSDGQSDSSKTDATDAAKKEGGFNLPSIPLIDNAVQSIKGTLGIDASKQSDAAKTDDASATKSTTDQTDSATATTKKESGFSLPTMASLDSKVQSLKETLGFESSTKTDSSASSTSQSDSAKTDAAGTAKKEGGFNLPSIPLFDNAMQSIKGTLGLDETKQGDTAKTDSSGEKSTTDQSGSTPKKEGGFSLPTLPSFDNAMQSIKGTLGLSETKSESSDKSQEPASSGSGQGTSQPATTSSEAQK